MQLPRWFSAILKSHWFNTGLGLLVLAAVIWFFGPLLGFGEMHPLDSQLARLMLIGVLFVLWLAINLMRMAKARKRDKALVDNVVAATPDKDATASAEEVALLGDRLKEALQKLKKVPGGKRGRRRLYQLPWYMFIGPPGAGKTTALVNSGLNFPLPTPRDRPRCAGVGGTRNCDWWFTDEAVLIDTAGRYTTQDSQAAVDSARLARLPAPAQEAPPPPAAERRAAGHRPARPCRPFAKPSGSPMRARCASACASCTTNSACAFRSTCCSPRPT